MNEKFYSWMDRVGFFGGSVQDTNHDAVDTFFTEETFRDVLNYDEDMFDEMGAELDMAEIDWDRIRFLAHAVLDDWLESVTLAASALGRQGGKSRSAAKTAAARANAEKARSAIDRQKQASAVAEANRRRKQG